MAVPTQFACEFAHSHNKSLRLLSEPEEAAHTSYRSNLEGNRDCGCRTGVRAFAWFPEVCSTETPIKNPTLQHTLLSPRVSYQANMVLRLDRKVICAAALTHLVEGISHGHRRRSKCI